jgi:hypothetical protein
MAEDLLDACVAQSLLGLAVEQPVDEISCFQRPVLGNLLLSNLWLPGEHLLSDFLARAPPEGSTPQHQFVRDDAHCKVVCGESMILSAKHLWRHVSWSSTRISAVINPERSCHSQVSDSSVALPV